MSLIRENRLATEKTQKSIWRNDKIRRLSLGLVVSVMGDGFLLVALPYVEYRETHSAAVLTSMSTAMTLGGVLAYTVSGTLIDRFNRRMLMLIADAARAVLVLLLALLLQWQGHGGGWATAGAFPLMLLTLSLISGFGALFTPALQMSVPAIVEPENLPKANGWVSSAKTVGSVAGYSLAGLFMAHGSAQQALMIDVISFLWSLACVLWAGDLGAPPAQARASLWHDIQIGLRYLLQNRKVRNTILGGVAMNFAAGPIIGLQMPTIGERLGSAAWIWGIVSAGSAAGFVIASLWLSPQLMKLSHRGRNALGFAALSGACQVGFGLSRWLWLSLLLIILSGLCMGVYNMTILQYFQTQVQEAQRGKIFGVYITLVQIVTPITIAVSGPLAAVVGSAATVLSASGGLLLITAVLLQFTAGLREL